MYHFFAKNEELKNEKESKKYPQQRQLGPPTALVGAPSTHTYTCHQFCPNHQFMSMSPSI
jgi:hypothetical protein